MIADLNKLAEDIERAFPGKVVSLKNELDELTLVVAAPDLHKTMLQLRDDSSFRFEQLIDLCGIDYAAYGSDEADSGIYALPEEQQPAGGGKGRFAAVYHLLSQENNARLRVRAFAEDDELPMLDSVSDIWASANWYEREAFDMYGIIFAGHPDLRRILTDYGFVGNPFRKDFPLSGHVEMRYDPEMQRVVYQPLTLEPRQVTPRSIREENYGRHTG